MKAKVKNPLQIATDCINFFVKKIYLLNLISN